MRAMLSLDRHGRKRGVRRYVFVTNFRLFQYGVSRVRTEF